MEAQVEPVNPIAVGHTHNLAGCLNSRMHKDVDLLNYVNF